jgi:uncharacterized protein YbgA (DUF1722 family)
LKENYGATEIKELIAAIRSFEAKVSPLSAPIFVLKQLLANCPLKNIEDSYYLNPYPAEFSLRKFL